MFHEHGDLRERTFQLGRRVARLFAALPARNRLSRIYGDQLVRAANSVGANYREAQRARSRAEHRAKLGDCLREADETLLWLERSRRKPTNSSLFSSAFSNSRRRLFSLSALQPFSPS
jgi:four helix bundle protein